jgi:hypothetical protein
MREEEERCRAYWELAELIGLDEMSSADMASA